MLVFVAGQNNDGANELTHVGVLKFECPGVEFAARVLQINGRRLKASVWDTAGQVGEFSFPVTVLLEMSAVSACLDSWRHFLDFLLLWLFFFLINFFASGAVSCHH